MTTCAYCGFPTEHPDRECGFATVDGFIDNEQDEPVGFFVVAGEDSGQNAIDAIYDPAGDPEEQHQAAMDDDWYSLRFGNY